jgi:polyisoprenoid-binding protein YceI
MPRNLRALIFALAAVVLAAAAPAEAADAYTIDKNHSDVSFQIRHFVSKVRGRFSDFEGSIQIDPAKPESSSVALTIQAASIDTNQPKRDDDLRSDHFFDVAKFPVITFQSTRIVPTGKDRYDVTGTLTMHGVTKEITLPVSFLGFMKDPRGNERAGFEIATKLNRLDYGISWNRALEGGGTLLGDDVDVTIDFETVKKAPEAAAAK